MGRQIAQEISNGDCRVGCCRNISGRAVSSGTLSLIMMSVLLLELIISYFAVIHHCFICASNSSF